MEFVTRTEVYLIPKIEEKADIDTYEFRARNADEVPPKTANKKAEKTESLTWHFLEVRPIKSISG
jgi:hypothetical protein